MGTVHKQRKTTVIEDEAFEPTAENLIKTCRSRSALWIPGIFVAATLVLYYLSINFPENSASSNSTIKFPSSMEELTTLSARLRHYKTDHFGFVLTLFCFAYLYKQTFAIPGSVFLNVLAGALYGSFYGFVLVCLLTAFGASLCYMLSDTFGKAYLVYYFTEKINFFQKKVDENMDGLFFYLLFLRLFPMSPNWFMNMAAPVVGVPIYLFFPSVFIGLMPYNFLCVRAGCMLSQIKSLEDMLSLWAMFQLAILALVALVPGLVIKSLHQRYQKTEAQKAHPF